MRFDISMHRTLVTSKGCANLRREGAEPIGVEVVDAERHGT